MTAFDSWRTSDTQPATCPDCGTLERRRGVPGGGASRPRLLDLFCGAGGCAVGYHRAGFDVVGVDAKPQPRYPFEFHQGDAFEFLEAHGHEFDAIHASPPCQAYSVCGGWRPQAEHPTLIEPVRELLTATGLPFVIENVVGAPLHGAAMLCGSAFGLRVRRHRIFEGSFPLFGTQCRHGEQGPCVGVYGNQGRRIGHWLGRARNVADASNAMGIDWMTWRELTQAIPPAYTEFIGRQLLRVVAARGAGR